jgi:hypothetical protein
MNKPASQAARHVRHKLNEYRALCRSCFVCQISRTFPFLDLQLLQASRSLWGHTAPAKSPSADLSCGHLVLKAGGRSVPDADQPRDARPQNGPLAIGAHRNSSSSLARPFWNGAALHPGPVRPITRSTVRPAPDSQRSANSFGRSICIIVQHSSIDVWGQARPAGAIAGRGAGSLAGAGKLSGRDPDAAGSKIL